MTRSKSVLSVAVLLVAASALVAQTKPGPKAVTITAGDDGWTTPGGGKTVVDLTEYPITKIFGGRVEGSSRVSLKGKPLSSDLGEVDTIVKRSKDIVLRGGKGSGPLEIVALSLDSENPVSIGGKKYRVHVGLAEAKKEGSISLTARNGDGGTFSASLPVIPKLVFTPEGGGQAMTIDCSAVPCGKGGKGFLFLDKATPWAMSGGPRQAELAALRPTPLKAGVRVGGEGSPEYMTVGASNFFPGVSTAEKRLVVRAFSTGPHQVAVAK
jgi:hypothetical protein